LRTKHVVTQKLSYQERPEEASRVCVLFGTRQEMRKKDPLGASDKANNPLVALPGSPGSGKSTFLVNFPSSEEYLNYSTTFYGATMVDGSPMSPIVSSFTFVGAMNGGEALLGLRILFGAAKAMGLPLEVSWDDFYMVDYGKYHSLNAKQAVQIIQQIFGKERPILLLVDEISKVKGPSNADALVMSGLGDVLDDYDHVDILVSSLSPLYISKLMTGSQRSVRYVVPSPLLRTGLGKSYCDSWTKKLIASVGGVGVDIFTKNLLSNFYLIYSGSPRAIEKMKDKFDRRTINDAVIVVLKKVGMKIKNLLFECLLLKMEVDNMPKLTHSFSPEELERFVFSAPEFITGEDEVFRRLLEGNKVFVQRTEGEVETPRFCVAVPAWSLLEWIANISVPNPDIRCSKVPRTDAARLLFQRWPDDSPSLWWERIVELAIVSRSYGCPNSSLNSIFGLARGCDQTPKEAYRLGIHFAIDKEGYRALPDSSRHNTLTVYQDGQSGFDAHALIHQQFSSVQSHFYLQMKIQSPQKKGQNRTKTTAEVLAHALPFTLLNHILRYNEGIDKAEDILGNVNFVLYNWALGRESPLSINRLPADPELDLQNLKNAVLAGWDKSKGGELPSESIEEWITDMVNAKQIPERMVSIERVSKSGRKTLLKRRNPNSRRLFLLEFDALVKMYVEKYFESNVHVVDGPTLEKWISPSFLPFPMLLTALGVE
jgi:hypothetical protein